MANEICIKLSGRKYLKEKSAMIAIFHRRQKFFENLLAETNMLLHDQKHKR
jgi:hypothetical protein